jgi:uncharacterized protein
MNAIAAESYIIRELKEKLPGNLYYHGLHHTLDVTGAAMTLAQQEGITDKNAIVLLRTAALFHDCGFISDYAEHEAAGCRIVRQILPEFGFSTTSIEVICGMITATKLPQNPQNKLEMILCDADLDYLGRTDFKAVASTLYDERKERNLVKDLDSWNKTQIQFLQNHRYFTTSQIMKREELKQKHLQELIDQQDDV